MSSESESLIDDRHCFVCGDRNPDGLHLSWEEDEDGWLRTTFVPGKRFQGWKDVVHGGILSTILDETMVNHRVYRGVPVVSVELTVRFREPGTIDQPIAFQGRSESLRGRLYSGEARCFQAGELLAEAEAKLMEVSDEVRTDGQNT